MKRDSRLMRPLSLTLITLAAASLGWTILAAPALADDWPQYRGPQHTGISAEKGWSTDWPKEGPKVLWKAELGKGYSAFSVVGNKAYTMGWAGEKDTVWCLDVATGQPVWKHTYPCIAGEYPGPRCSPTVDGKLVYTLSRQGDLFCLDAEKGDVKWSKSLTKDFKGEVPGWQNTKWGYACSPLVMGDKLVVDAGPAVVLNKITGETVWVQGDDVAGYSSPQDFKLGDATYLAFFEATALVVRNAADGKEVARQTWKTSYNVNPSTPIVSGDQIFISSGYGIGAALYQFSGTALKEVWKAKVMRTHTNSCVLYNGSLYGLDGAVNEGPLSCVDFKTGEKKWKEESVKMGGLVIADGKIIALGNQGDLVVATASPDGYKEIAKAKVLGETCWTMPVLANGMIFCRNEKGNAVCLDVKGK